MCNSRRAKIILMLAVLALGMFFSSKKAFAGAWTVPKYKVWGELTFKWNWSKFDYSPENHLDHKSNDGRSWGWSMEPKVEYGITDWFNVLASVEYKESKYKEYGRAAGNGPFRRKNNGITAIRLGGKLRFLEKPAVVSGLVKVHIYPGYGNNDGDDPAFRNQPSIGDGEDTLELRGLIGKEFFVPLGMLFNEGDYSLKCYGGFEAGYAIKNRDVCNNFPYLIEAGFWPLDWLLIKTEIDGIFSHDGTGTVEKEYAIWRIGPVFQVLSGDSVTKQGKMFNIELQYGNTFWGRNTAADQEFIVKAQSQF